MQKNKNETTNDSLSHPNEELLRELTFEELSVLCSNLAKGCEKQYRMEESALFSELSTYYHSKVILPTDQSFADLQPLILQDLSSDYDSANQIALSCKDRGALRALKWGEKVSRILTSLLSRYDRQKDALIESTNVYVCEICGFVYLGAQPPTICPICKVPSIKMTQIRREGS